MLLFLLDDDDDDDTDTFNEKKEEEDVIVVRSREVYRACVFLSLLNVFTALKNDDFPPGKCIIHIRKAEAFITSESANRTRSTHRDQR